RRRGAETGGPVRLASARMDVRLGKARADRVDPHALPCELLREPDGEAGDRALRPGVVDIVEGRAEPGRDRRDRHDRAAPPAAAAREPARGLAGADIGAEHVDLEEPAHALD